MPPSACCAMRWSGTSSASRKPPGTFRHLKTRHPEIPWRKVAGIGNILRHAYPIVDDSLIWEVVVRDLPRLKAAVEQMLREVNVGNTGK
jgi:uncharacterized protein with HEPN domain